MVYLLAGKNVSIHCDFISFITNSDKKNISELYPSYYGSLQPLSSNIKKSLSTFYA